MKAPPQRVVVLGDTYRIAMSSPNDTLIARHCLADGEVHTQKRQITLDKALDNSVAHEIVCHEVAEIWNHSLELRLPHRTITALGHALHRFLEDNNA